MLPLLAVAVVSAAANAQDTGFAPFALAEVDFEPECTPNAAFERVLTLFARTGSRPPADDDELVLDEPLYNAVSGDTWQRLMLDDAVEWHGLQLKGIELHLGIERGPANYALRFADPPERVRAVWNARGWKLPPVDEDRDVEGLEGYASISVRSEEGGGASVTCFRD